MPPSMRPRARSSSGGHTRPEPLCSRKLGPISARAIPTCRNVRAQRREAGLPTQAGPDLGKANPALPERASAAVRAWQAYVRDLVRSQGMSKRATARFLSFGINGVALLVMLAVFASTAGLTGAEIGVAAGSSALSQKLLEATVGDQAVRSLATDARQNLVQRLDDILADEARRFTTLLDGAGVDPDLPAWLRGQ